MHGKVTLEVRGSIYKGDFVQNKKEGFGTMKFMNGQLYHGFWKNGKPRVLFFFSKKKNKLKIFFRWKRRNDCRNVEFR